VWCGFQPTADGRDGVQSTASLTRRAFLTLTLAWAGGLLLAGCQQPITPSRSTAPTPIPLLPTPEPRPTQTPPVAGRPGTGVPITPTPGPPKPGGRVVWAAETDPPDLFSDGQVYQSLVMFDEHLKLVPGLAAAWSVSDDWLTWTFKLRQGVIFHDGSEFEAEDVRFWFERTMAPRTASPYAHLFQQIARVEPAGKYEVRFTLSAPHAPLLATFAGLRGSAIAPRRWLQRNGGSRTTAVGSGPFTVAEYVPGSHIRYVKHPDYWEQGLPYLDEARIEVIPVEDQRGEALQGGRVSYAAIGPAAAQQLKRDFAVISSAGPTQQVTIFNTRRKPFDDVRVRQAIDLVLDRQVAIKRVAGGEARLTGPVPLGLDAWGIPPESLPYHQDLATARHLIDEAGYVEGFEATIRTAADAPLMLGTALVLAEQVQVLGITMKVEQLAGAALTQAIDAGDFDLASGEIGFSPDPDPYFSRYLSRGRSPGPGNASAWSNARYDELVEQARVTMDPGGRKSLYDEAASIVLHEAPTIWWFCANTLEALHPSVKGYRPSFAGRRQGLKKAWLAR
jgi:peptide/nickel transport system substrate-binding protein